MSETNNQATQTPSIEELAKVGEKLASSKANEADPLDTHAQMFYMYGPRLRNTLMLMSKKALVRLVFSLIQHPLNDKEIKMREKIEQDAFQIADQMLTSKYFMILGSYMDVVTKMQEDQNNTGQKTEPVVESKEEVKTDG
jgi:hypothetical protein